MRALCVSNHPCSYRTDTGYCGYTGNGCALNDTATALSFCLLESALGVGDGTDEAGNG